jgi:hypothetical protein
MGKWQDHHEDQHRNPRQRQGSITLSSIIAGNQGNQIVKPGKSQVSIPL